MIEYKTGDILEEHVDALVNTVNCVGFMGRGIALQFKKAWPENFQAYAAACRRHEVQPGRMFVYETGRLTPPRYIINFPTKRHWRGKSRMGDIEAGLAALVAEVRKRGIRSIAVPPLGAGLGGLDWARVRARIARAMEGLRDVRVVVFEPDGAMTRGKGSRSRKASAPAMTPGRAALVGLMDRYRAGLLDPFVSLLEVHKLMYFMQEAGERLRLRLTKGPYGPYAENLRHVLAAIEGYYVLGYGTGGDAPDTALELIPGAVEDARAALTEAPETLARFERVAELVEGFESPFGLELLATVHWVMTREQAASESEVIDRTYEWGDRKQQFSRQQILLARNVLAERGWVRQWLPKREDPLARIGGSQTCRVWSSLNWRCRETSLAFACRRP
jgi:O-acetyl-ADP-ribose deacetylase (regulator of RNase III)